MSVHSRFWHFHNSPVEAKERPTTAAEFVYLECGCCLERLDLHVWEKKRLQCWINRVHHPTVICHKLWVFLSLFIHPGKRRVGGEEGGVGGWSEVILVENSHQSPAASALYRALALRAVHHRCRGFGTVSRNSTFTLIGNAAEKHQCFNTYFSLELVLSYFLFETMLRQH